MTLLGLAVALLFTGCTSVERLAEVLDARNVTSCITATGMYAPFVVVRVLTATGGATVQDCAELRW